MRVAEHAGEGGQLGRSEDEVDVVGHQAPSPDGDAVRPALRGEQVALAAVAPPGDVMRQPRRDRACHPCHVARVTETKKG